MQAGRAAPQPAQAGEGCTATKRGAPGLARPFGSKSNSCGSGVLACLPDIDVGVDVGGAAEMPDEGRAFEAPDVPDLVFANVGGFVEGQVQLVQAAAFLEDLDRLFNVFGAVRREDDFHHLFDEALLVCREL